MLAPSLANDNYVIVAEEEIMESSIHYGEVVDDPKDNQFLQLLEAGKLYREAGLTPLYLFGQVSGLTITSRELAEGTIKLH